MLVGIYVAVKACSFQMQSTAITIAKSIWFVNRLVKYLQRFQPRAIFRQICNPCADRGDFSCAFSRDLALRSVGSPPRLPIRQAFPPGGPAAGRGLPPLRHVPPGRLSGFWGRVGPPKGPAQSPPPAAIRPLPRHIPPPAGFWAFGAASARQKDPRDLPRRLLSGPSRGTSRPRQAFGLLGPHRPAKRTRAISPVGYYLARPAAYDGISL
jgi:hypothetical protein